ncbi:MAG: hypothetical protein P8Z41_14435 [Anaerolineales bacterium]
MTSWMLWGFTESTTTPAFFTASRLFVVVETPNRSSSFSNCSTIGPLISTLSGVWVPPSIKRDAIAEAIAPGPMNVIN